MNSMTKLALLAGLLVQTCVVDGQLDAIIGCTNMPLQTLCSNDCSTACGTMCVFGGNDDYTCLPCPAGADSDYSSYCNALSDENVVVGSSENPSSENVFANFVVGGVGFCPSQMKTIDVCSDACDGVCDGKCVIDNVIDPYVSCAECESAEQKSREDYCGIDVGIEFGDAVGIFGNEGEQRSACLDQDPMTSSDLCSETCDIDCEGLCVYIIESNGKTYCEKCPKGESSDYLSYCSDVVASGQDSPSCDMNLDGSSDQEVNVLDVIVLIEHILLPSE